MVESMQASAEMYQRRRTDNMQEEVLSRGKYRCECGGNGNLEDSAKRMTEFVILRLKHRFMLIIESVI